MRHRILISLMVIILAPMVIYAQKDTIEFKKKLDKLFDVTDAPGAAVLVSKGDETIFAYYNGLKNLETREPIGRGTHFRMASITKQITAHAIYSLVQKGKIQASTLITEIFNDLPLEFAAIRIEHLLQHSAGLPDYEDMIPKEQKEQLSDQDVLNLIIRRPKLKFPPGDQFRYSNTGYCVLALIVQKVSGISFAEYVKENLFKPINIQEGLIYTPQSKIVDRAFGYHPIRSKYLYADQSITSATQGDGGAYLSQAEIQKWCNFITYSISTDSVYRNLHNNGMKVNHSVSYQLGLFKITDENKNIHLFHSGESTGFQNILYIDVNNDLSITILTNRDDFIISQMFDELLSFYGRNLVMQKNLGKSTFIWLSDVYMGY